MAGKAIRRVALGADHAGYRVKERIKEFLQKSDYEVIDFGTHAEESVDYPDYSGPVAQSVASAEADRGILVCGTGIGTAMAANKIAGIRAANCNDTYTARMATEHNDANVLAVGARVVDADHAIAIVKEWLGARFQGGRHQRRIEKIAQLERNQALAGKK
ncbi:MAG: ribose 5-phosphate isomerase B [Terriglobia bacterium]